MDYDCCEPIELEIPSKEVTLSNEKRYIGDFSSQAKGEGESQDEWEIRPSYNNNTSNNIDEQENRVLQMGFLSNMDDIAKGIKMIKKPSKVDKKSNKAEETQPPNYEEFLAKFISSKINEKDEVASDESSSFLPVQKYRDDSPFEIKESGFDNFRIEEMHDSTEAPKKAEEDIIEKYVLDDYTKHTEKLVETGSLENAQEPKKEPMCVMVVELDKGNYQNIKIFEDTKPDELAYEFCKEHGLDVNSLHYLTEKIGNLLSSGTGVATNHIDAIQEVDEEMQDQSSANIKRKESDIEESNLNIGKSNSNLKQEILKYKEKERTKNTVVFSKMLDDHIKSTSVVELSLKDKSSENNSSQKNLFLYSKILDIENKGGMRSTFSEGFSKLNLTQRPSLSNAIPKEDCKQSKPERKSTEKLAGSNNSHKFTSSIFERLYKAQKKNTSKKEATQKSPKIATENSKNKSRPRTASCLNGSSTPKKSVNIGEKLYWKGVKYQEEKSKRLEQKRKYVEIANISELQDFPIINQDKNFSLLKTKSNFCNSSEFLEIYHFEKRKKIEEIERQIPVPSYSFRPKINLRSQHIDNKINIEELRKEQAQHKSEQEGTSNNISRFNSENTEEAGGPYEVQVHQHAKEIGEMSPRHKRQLRLYNLNKMRDLKLKQKEQAIYSKFSFQPYFYTKLNNQKKDEKMEENKLADNSFETRLKKYSQLKSERQEKVFQHYYSSKHLFKPILVSNNDLYLKHNVNTEENKPVSQYQLSSNPYESNYLFSKKYDFNRSAKERKIHQMFTEEANQSHVTSGSNFIFESKKEKVFSRLFRLLDSDNDELITAVNYDTRGIDPCIIKVIFPILNELKQENENLNEREFILACNQLFKMLDYNERKILLGMESKQRNVSHSKTEEAAMRIRSFSKNQICNISSSNYSNTTSMIRARDASPLKGNRFID